VIVITNPQSLAQYREAWDAVYDADDEAHFFLSWSYMSWRLQNHGARCFVMVATAEAAPATPVAFFPLTTWRQQKGDVVRHEVTTAGSPAADYTGFICRPEYAKEASAAFANALKSLIPQLRWDDLNLDNIRMSDERLNRFLSRFHSSQFDVLLKSAMNADEIDNAICPYVALPEDWERYLNEVLSANMRQKLRRLLRQVEASPELRFAQSTPDTIEGDVGALLHLWSTKWGPRKQGDMEAIRARLGSMLMHFYGEGKLFLPSLQRNGTIVSALAIFVDRSTRSYLFLLAGRDETFSGPSPGLCLHAHAIRHAIENGFRTYDFLRGDEAYKFSFGAKSRAIRNITVRRRPDAVPAPSPAVLEEVGAGAGP
jgi:CelD/BcsL family acetyltransferase involved in cellulose biosynthesis